MDDIRITQITRIRLLCALCGAELDAEQREAGCTGYTIHAAPCHDCAPVLHAEYERVEGRGEGVEGAAMSGREATEYMASAAAAALARAAWEGALAAASEAARAAWARVAAAAEEAAWEALAAARQAARAAILARGERR